jgi:hypothetical protein
MKTTHLLSVVSLIPVLACAADASFYSFSMSGPLGKGGAQVSMKFEEIDRTDTNSIVEVSGASPGSDLSTGFLLNGMCGLAKKRGQSYFQAKQVDTDPLTFEVTFPKTAPNSPSASLSGIAPNVFPVSQCPAVTYGPQKN